MDSYQETFNTWNKIALLYQDKFMDLDLYNESYDSFCELIPKQQASILEIGCGPGNITQYILTKRPDFIIEGIDVAPNMVKLAQQNNPNAHFRVMDARSINELSNTYDAIIGGFCLPYFAKSDCVKLIENCQTILNSKGLLYLSFVEGDETLSGFKVGSSGDGIYFYYHSLPYIEGLFRKNGFETRKLFKVNYKKGDGSNEVHTILIASKKE